jgi:hypothetical protein
VACVRGTTRECAQKEVGRDFQVEGRMFALNDTLSMARTIYDELSASFENTTAVD